MLSTLQTISGKHITSLINVGGIFYGTTSSDAQDSGTIFRYVVATNTYTPIVVFTGLGGSYPGQDPMSLIMYGTTLYGITNKGGTYDLGTMFMFTYPSLFYTLITFSGPDGTFEGMNPNSLVLYNNVFYGTTSSGTYNGTSTFGSMFNCYPVTNNAATLFKFTGSRPNYPGTNPNSLVICNNMIYGTTIGNTLGSIFTYDDSGFNTVFNFTNIGSHKLLVAYTGELYGVYASDNGSVFKYANNQLTTLITFTGISGNFPGTTPNSLDWYNNVLYGTTYSGGTSNSGTLFSYDGTFNLLENFSTYPNSLVNYNGIYGTTYGLSDGTIFKYSSNSVTCFKEDTRILTKEGYKPVQDLKKGDLVKTLLHEFLPIHMIGKQSIKHEALSEHTKNQLYSGPNELVVTGCHSILVDSYANKEQCDRSRDVNSGLFQTDKKYRLPACVDDRFKVYDVPGTYTVYHLALENDNMFTNYGIYANDLLVESCSKNYLLNRSNMIIL